MPTSRQERNQLESRKEELRERDRVKKLRERAEGPDNMSLVQALREFLGLQPLPGIPKK